MCCALSAQYSAFSPVPFWFHLVFLVSPINVCLTEYLHRSSVFNAVGRRANYGKSNSLPKRATSHKSAASEKLSLT